MKKATLIVSVLLVTFAACAQELPEANVPAAVKTKFSSMHANAKGVKWEMENGKYEAEFDQNGIETSILFETNGTHFQTETEIPVSTLPKVISDYTAKNFAGKVIKEAAKITGADGTITYEAEIDDMDFIFDSNGDLIKKEAEDGDAEDED